MRLGLHSQLRRRWCPKAEKLVQPQQMRFEWNWLFLAVDVLKGRLFWRWQERLRSDCVEATVQAWRREEGIDALVWDNAPAHHAKVVEQVGVTLCFLPPFSPELNPAERVFEEVRRYVEGCLYDSLEHKRQAAEAFLSALAADTARVRRLVGWGWITSSLQALPEPVPINMV